MLNVKRILELAGRPNVRKTAVQNFLGTLGEMNRNEALANLNQDARSYRWDAQTVSTIREGISEHFA